MRHKKESPKSADYCRRDKWVFVNKRVSFLLHYEHGNDGETNEGIHLILQEGNGLKSTVCKHFIYSYRSEKD